MDHCTFVLLERSVVKLPGTTLVESAVTVKSVYRVMVKVALLFELLLSVAVTVTCWPSVTDDGAVYVAVYVLAMGLMVPPPVTDHVTGMFAFRTWLCPAVMPWDPLSVTCVVWTAVAANTGSVRLPVNVNVCDTGENTYPGAVGVAAYVPACRVYGP